MVLFPLLMLIPMARYPNAIEKTVVLQGDAAISVAALFGLSSGGRVSLPLFRQEVNVYNSKTYRHEKKREPARYNVVEFSAAPTASLKISPYWLDLQTGSPSPPKPGYSFSSPLVLEKPDATTPWSAFLQKFKKEIPQTEWSTMQKGEQPSVQRCFGFAENWELCLDVYAAKVSQEEGYVIYLTVRPYFPEREKLFEEWQKSKGHLEW